MKQRSGGGKRAVNKRLHKTNAISADSSAASPQVPIAIRSEWMEQGRLASIRSEFSTGVPYPHAIIRPFLGEDGLYAVRADLERIGAKEKETDLFRFFQTGDLAGALLGNRPEGAPMPKKRRRRGLGTAISADASKRAPSLTALAHVFASDAFRDICSTITQCGPLSDRVDLSAQIYSRRGHLLCHDDVIGTRKVSFIYYLTDPVEEWQASEGGALELYPQEPGATLGTPSVTPTKELLPLADSLALFVVEPGVSFHAVREVRGSRARVSIQGWLHAPSLEQTAAFDRRSFATLQQLLDRRVNGPSCMNPAEDTETVPAEKTELHSKKPNNPDHCSEVVLSAADVAYLSKFLAKEYIDTKCMDAISERFAEASYAVLTGFLRKDLVDALKQAHSEADEHDGFNAGAVETPAPVYDAGVAGGWRTVGPPHLRRFLRFDSNQSKNASNTSAASQVNSPQVKLGNELQNLTENLFSSEAFNRWLQLCTRLEPRGAARVEARRFRPGLDYTVAARAETAILEAAELDVTLAFVADGTAENTELWEGEDVGGFESYIAADEEEETAEAQETYRGTDLDGPLVNLPAASNALCLVMRDSQTFRFVKYLSRDAPSSRVDVTASYTVDAPDDTSDEENDTHTGEAGEHAPNTEKAKSDD